MAPDLVAAGRFVQAIQITTPDAFARSSSGL